MKLKTITKILLISLIPVIYYFLFSGFSGSKESEENRISLLTPVPEGKNSIISFCKGQSFVYEAEGGNGTCCKTISGGKIIEDSGRAVVYSGKPEEEKPCYLFENKHETGRNTVIDKYGWIIKPEMRIRKSDFSNLDERPVAAIVIYDSGGLRVDSAIIRVMNFSDKNTGEYQGEYKSEYLFMTACDLKESRLWGMSKGERKSSVMRIYWYGRVELWIDKVTVNDPLAEELFSGSYDAFILNETTPFNLIKLSSMVQDEEFSEGNYKCINYIMNVMYQKLHNKAQPISLK